MLKWVLGAGVFFIVACYFLGDAPEPTDCTKWHYVGRGMAPKSCP